MEFVCVAVAVFSLLAVGQSAPVSVCEGLNRPREIPGRDQLLGKWVHIGESTDIPGGKSITKMLVGTVWWNLTAAEESDKLLGFLNQKMLGLCFTFKTETTLVNNSLTMEKPYTSTAILLSTSCPDCLVFYSTNIFGNRTYHGLQLLSRRNSVTADELEEFKKQVECMNLPPPTFLDQSQGFCPDPSQSQETSAIDLTTTVTAEDLTQLDNIIRSEDGDKMLLKMITSAVSLLKQN